MVHLAVRSCHVTLELQSESTLYSCLNVKGFFTQNRRKIWKLNDCNCTRNHNHLVCKSTLNYLAKLAKWLSWVVNTCLYGVFDCMFLSCQVRISEWRDALYFSEWQGTPCWKPKLNLKFKWLQLDSKPLLVMSRTHFLVNPASTVSWRSRNFFPKTGTKSEVYKWLWLDSKP